MSPDLAITFVYVGYALAVLLTFGAVLTWVERKQAAIMSDRIGANRAYLRLPFTQVKLIWWGLFHGMADGLKLLLKEDFRPNAYDRLAYALGPWLAFVPVMLVFAVIPFGGTLDPGRLFPSLAEWFGGRTYPMQIAPLDAGLLVVFAFGGISIIGAMLAGWSSANKFSLLGALRAGSQLISYELVMGLTILGLILIFGTVDLVSIVEQQSGTVLGFLPAWGIVYQPFAAILFLTAGIAENIHRDRDHRGAVHDAVPRRLQPAVAHRRGLRAAGQPHHRTVTRLGGRAAGAHVPRQGAAAVQLPDPGALDSAALPLGPAAALRVEVPAAARDREPRRDRARGLGAAVRCA